MKGARCWTDCHNHLHLVPGGGSLLGEMAAAGVGRCVVNSTCEEEWEPVAELARTWPCRVVPAFGIHPWRATDAAEDWETRLAELLAGTPGAWVGECGLDGAVIVDAARQRQVCAAQVRLARDLRRPLALHVVRAWGALLGLLEREPPPPKWLLHGYSGSLETARRLARLGAWFSGGAGLLDPRRRAALEVFRQLPPDRVVLETDAAARGPSPADLPRLGVALAALLDEDADRFSARMECNAEELLG